MPRFFTEEIEGARAFITGEDAEHISLSLRMRKGEPLVVCDGHGTDYRCIIEDIRREQVTLYILDKSASPGEPNVRVTLFQALCKGEKMDMIIQKSVELGIFDIVPVITERCVVKTEDKTFDKKRIRYNRIALEAAKQSGRGRIPKVWPVIQFSDLVSRMHGFERSLFCYENAVKPISSVSLTNMRNLSMVIGPEGGFAEKEAGRLTRAGAIPVSLGGRILRAETASLAALTAIMYAAGEM